MNFRSLIMVIIPILLVLNFSMIFYDKSYITGLFGATTSVGIIDQVDAVFYEEQKEDVIFEISLNADGNWYSYNGSYGGVKGGYDSFDNITQTFTLENIGSTNVDVLIAAEDFGIDEDYIDVSRVSGDFQIYIPGVGWKNIPDNNDKDIDGKKDDKELCLADLLLVGHKTTGFDFRIRNGISGNYTSQITITTYNNETSNPCKEIGTYVKIGENNED